MTAKVFGVHGLDYSITWGIDWGEPDEGRPEGWPRWQWYSESCYGPGAKLVAMSDIADGRRITGIPALGTLNRRYVIMTPVEVVRLP